MKKLFFLGMAAIFTLAACTRYEEFDFSKADLTLVAKTESPAETKTIVEDETHVYWEPGDAISVFSGGKSGKFVTDIAASAPDATFQGTLGKDAWTEGMDLWAVYPYSETAVLDGTSITTVLPSEQEARAGSFGKGVNLSVAHATTTELQFYNVGGGIRFSLSEEGIQRVVLTGMDGEVLAGKVTVGFQGGKPAILDVIDGKTSISLIPSEGDTFATDTWYYVVAVPGALEKGFTLHFQKADKVGLRVFDKPVTIKRGIFGQLSHADEGADYSTVSDNNIAFKDEQVESIVVKYFDTNEDGKLSYREAAVVLSFLVDKAETRSTDEKVSIFAGTGITSFDELVFFTGLTRIEEGTFAGCTELNSIIIPENIADIGDNAFNGCTNLQSITVTSTTPPVIGEDAFANTGDCPIYVPAGVVDEYVNAWNKYASRILGRQPLNEIWYASSDGQVVTPYAPDVFGASLVSNKYADGKGVMTFDGPVTELGYSAFYKCTNLVEISLPGMVGSMNDNAFGSCGLEHLVLPPSLTKIYSWSINDCPNLTEVFLPETVTYIDYGNFAYCPNITSITVAPENPVYDSRNGCNAIIRTADSKFIIGCQNSFIPEGGTEIGTFAFGGCENLRSITIPEGVDYIHWRAFTDCTALEEVTLPTTLTTMGVGLFQGCTSLKEITIPESVRVMGDYEFSGCASLTQVTVLPATPPSVFSYDADYRYGNFENLPPNPTTMRNSRMFEKTGDCPIYVPGGSMDIYLSDGIWGFYSDRIQAIPTPVPEAIDMGLPSGLKWASFNLGATKPEEYGDYFAWGETEPKEVYSWETYQWCMGSHETLTKYNTNPEYGYNGFTDGKTILDPEDDAAYVNLGGSWRMPTDVEWRELRENCTWTWTTLNGVDGMLVTATNGNSLFIPAAGYRYNSYLLLAGIRGNGWSSSLSTDYNAWETLFDAGGATWFGGTRCHGFSIRPVFGDPAIYVESVSLDKTELELSVGETATLTATVLPENATYKMVTWSSSDHSIATIATFSNGVLAAVAPGTATITVTTLDGGKTATCTVTVKEPEPYTVVTPEAVDLGLSVKWASFNLGAAKPEEFGDYFAWGETEPFYISLDPLVWKPDKRYGYNWMHYKWAMGSETTLTKYCSDEAYGYNGFTDGKITLDPEDDAAQVNLGDKWRMPTDQEWEELTSNCSFVWTQQNGVGGFTVTSKKPGFTDKSIFLPAAGVWFWQSLSSAGSEGYYWSLTGYRDSQTCSYGFWFNSSSPGCCSLERCFGFAIRPVYTE